MFKISIDAESPGFQTGSHWTLFGLALQLVAAVIDIPNQSVGWMSPAALFLAACGTAAIVIGVFYLARSKQRSPMWAILGLLSLFGWVLVAFLEDRSLIPDRPESPGSPAR